MFPINKLQIRTDVLCFRVCSLGYPKVAAPGRSPAPMDSVNGDSVEIVPNPSSLTQTVGQGRGNTLPKTNHESGCQHYLFW